MDILSLEIDSKYKKWLKNLYNGGDLHPSFVFMCNKHKRLNDKIPIEYRDIFNFKSIDDFISYVDSLESETEREDFIKNNGSTTIYENEDFLVKRIHNLDAMKLYGKGSKWCIASDDINIWNNYLKKGNVFFLVFSKKLPYTSQFNKFVVQLTNDRDLIVWDRSDCSYQSNIFDLINLDSEIFQNHSNLEIISNLEYQIGDITISNILIKNNAIIAGGSLTSIVSNNKINDFDIWFSNESDYKSAINDMSDLCKKRNINITEDFFQPINIRKYSTTNAITFTNNDNKKFQFIDPSKYTFGDVKTIINQFDFTCVMCGVDLKDRKLVYDNRFFNGIKFKMLIVNKEVKCPASLLDRIIKYTKKGYRISKESQRDALRLLSKVTEQEIDDATLTMY
jgi:hypothetical protein